MTLFLNQEEKFKEAGKKADELKLGSRIWNGIFEHKFNRVAESPTDSMWLFRFGVMQIFGQLLMTRTCQRANQHLQATAHRPRRADPHRSAGTNNRSLCHDTAWSWTKSNDLFCRLQNKDLLGDAFYLPTAIEKRKVFSIGPQREKILVMARIRVA